MGPSSIKVSNEFVHVVWASHILKFLNPYTSTASRKYSLPDQEVDDLSAWGKYRPGERGGAECKIEVLRRVMKEKIGPEGRGCVFHVGA
ncbi:hypothetical protein BDV23DRAFT_157908 [Aspergillus alliaceus]|uniref:Uncharacterized protein n=1 Tax=Petromyces alliaceus TaxID=209559 RepID=A0A5N7C5M2_PETAA|nr:hypothetical protein BDV23DRAFT_157908 [Aspergillus alliaceus]